MQASFDIRSAIVRHPYLAVTTAALAGAAFAFAERSRSLMLRAAAITISGIVVAAVRQRVTVELEELARSWLHQRNHPTPPRAEA